MGREPTTRLQVSGYRFLVHRMEHALLRGDVSMRHDPLRAQSWSFVAGCVLALVAVAVCAILAFLRPDVAVGDAAIVMSRDTGALYVSVGDTLHPVLNLASAYLIAGNATKPRVVNDDHIEAAKRGPLLGIPGAPADIAEPLSEEESAWTVCDDATTTVIAGDVDGLDRGRREPGVLVTARSEGAASTYLLYEGRRAEVDLRNPGVVWALRLDGIAPRPVSTALLDAIPEAPPIAAPSIPAAGKPSAVSGVSVGTVVRLDSEDLFVVLADGVQRVGEVAANLIRAVHVQSSQEIPSLSPGTISGLPRVDSLPVTTFPARAGAVSGADDDDVLCAGWIPTGPRVVIWKADSLPPMAIPVALAQGDGDQPGIDGVIMPSGRSAYVRAAPLKGSGGDADPVYLVTSSGVLFGIRDEATAKALGIHARPVPAPWPILARLPHGPELNRDSALVARDGIVLPP